jgi:hypothetical protein
LSYNRELAIKKALERISRPFVHSKMTLEYVNKLRDAGVDAEIKDAEQRQREDDAKVLRRVNRAVDKARAKREKVKASLLGNL